MMTYKNNDEISQVTYLCLQNNDCDCTRPEHNRRDSILRRNSTDFWQRIRKISGYNKRINNSNFVIKKVKFKQSL